MTFDQWWEQNKDNFNQKFGFNDTHVYSRREIAHAAWVFGSLTLSKAINKAIEENLREATNGL